MDVKKIYDDIQNLNNLIYQINKREYKAIEELNRLHRIVFGETVTTGCSNCHIKAFKKLILITIKELQEMADQKFKIKKEHLIEWPAGSGSFYSSKLGISDEVATAYLDRFPKHLDKFEVYPGSESESKELKLTKPKAEKVKEEKKD